MNDVTMLDREATITVSFLMGMNHVECHAYVIKTYNEQIGEYIINLMNIISDKVMRTRLKSNKQRAVSKK